MRSGSLVSYGAAVASCWSAAPLLFLLGACARMEPPPGGPPDAAPPRLLETRPDSFASLPDFDGEVEFLFDEVISEGGSPSTGAGTGDLERLVILSPTTDFPQVRWRRDRITVRPDEGWRRDRVYRVELLPGVTDLRQNRSDSGALVTFSTGAPRPTKTFRGTVVDWTSSRPAPAALVVALHLPDSLPYRGLADSSGQFTLGPLPAGQYVVSGVLDENRNHVADPREAFDSIRVAPGRDTTLELWTFVHDTTPPRISTVTATDSVSATVEFSQSLDPRQRLQTTAARVSLLPDSTPVRITSLLPRRVDDSLHAKPAAPPDSVAADTAAPRRPPAPGARARARPPAAEPAPGRPPLSDQLVLRPAAPWRPGARYFVEIRGVRNVTGVAGNAVGTLVVAERRARDTLATPADSLKRQKPQPAPADSSKRRLPQATPADSSRRRPAQPTPPRSP